MSFFVVTESKEVLGSEHTATLHWLSFSSVPSSLKLLFIKIIKSKMVHKIDNIFGKDRSEN